MSRMRAADLHKPEHPEQNTAGSEKKAPPVIESSVFGGLRDSGVINGHCILTDSPVLPGDTAYPTDIGLICDAFGKMRQFAEN